MNATNYEKLSIPSQYITLILIVAYQHSAYSKIAIAYTCFHSHLGT
jgi:hypothetical protein